MNKYAERLEQARNREWRARRNMVAQERRLLVATEDYREAKRLTEVARRESEGRR